MGRPRGRPPKVLPPVTDPVILAERRCIGEEAFEAAFGPRASDPPDLTVPELLRLLADKLEEGWPQSFRRSTASITGGS